MTIILSGPWVRPLRFTGQGRLVFAGNNFLMRSFLIRTFSTKRSFSRLAIKGTGKTRLPDRDIRRGKVQHRVLRYVQSHCVAATFLFTQQIYTLPSPKGSV